MARFNWLKSEIVRGFVAGRAGDGPHAALDFLPQFQNGPDLVSQLHGEAGDLLAGTAATAAPESSLRSTREKLRRAGCGA